MEYLEDQSLATHSTMRLGGKAKYLCTVQTELDLLDAIKFAKKHKIPLLVIGQGSNIVFTDSGYNGLIIVNNLKGVNIDKTKLQIVANSGEKWDEIVKLSIENNLAGIEALSLIPGTTGACPVNNIGAYGQEVKDVIKYVRAYDTTCDKFVELSNAQCNFSYRNSIFKTGEYGRYIITTVCFQLKPFDNSYRLPSYQVLANKLIGNNKPSLKDVRSAVISLRSSKLPDPDKIANTGSFFKNPIINQSFASQLRNKYPEMPMYPADKNMLKLAAGWLIEQAGLKGYEHNGMVVSDKQALVLINKSAKNYEDLAAIIAIIINKVYAMFGVMLEPEPEIIL